MSSINYMRQQDIIKPSEMQQTPVTIIGVGGGGSLLAFFLEKMGWPNIILYDHDVVEPHNIPNQMFRKSDVNLENPKPKVVAQKEIAEEFSDARVEIHHERFNGTQKLSEIVVSAVDKMEEKEGTWGRKEIWSVVVWNPEVHLFIDARTGGEVSMIFVIRPCDPDDVKFYEKFLYPSKEVTGDRRCAEQSIIDVAGVTVNLMANQIRKFVKGEEISLQILWDAKNLTLINRKRGEV